MQLKRVEKVKNGRGVHFTSWKFIKSETSEHAQLTITVLYILLANILTWYQLETYIEDTPRKMGSQVNVMNMVM